VNPLNQLIFHNNSSNFLFPKRSLIASLQISTHFLHPNGWAYVHSPVVGSCCKQGLSKTEAVNAMILVVMRLVAMEISLMRAR
jgi:hypothetical protein